MQKTTTFLMFVGEQYGKAEEAIELYVSLFENSAIKTLQHYEAGEPGGNEGNVKLATFVLDGNEYMASENNFGHAFNFTPAISIYVHCQTESELETLFQKLSDQGQIMMPLDNYGFSLKFGWTADKYGVSWQLNLAA